MSTRRTGSRTFLSEAKRTLVSAAHCELVQTTGNANIATSAIQARFHARKALWKFRAGSASDRNVRDPYTGHARIRPERPAQLSAQGNALGIGVPPRSRPERAVQLASLTRSLAAHSAALSGRNKWVLFTFPGRCPGLNAALPLRGVTRSQALLGNAAPEALLHNPSANTSVVRRDFQRRESPIGSAPETIVPAERSSGDCIPKQSLGTRTNTLSFTCRSQRAARVSLPLICADRCGSVGKYFFIFLLRELRDLRGKSIHDHPGATNTP
jgi:hypothetical protein